MYAHTLTHTGRNTDLYLEIVRAPWAWNETPAILKAVH